MYNNDRSHNYFNLAAKNCQAYIEGVAQVDPGEVLNRRGQGDKRVLMLSWSLDLMWNLRRYIWCTYGSLIAEARGGPYSYQI